VPWGEVLLIPHIGSQYTHLLDVSIASETLLMGTLTIESGSRLTSAMHCQIPETSSISRWFHKAADNLLWQYISVTYIFLLIVTKSDDDRHSCFPYSIGYTHNTDTVLNSHRVLLVTSLSRRSTDRRQSVNTSIKLATPWRSHSTPTTTARPYAITT